MSKETITSLFILAAWSLLSYTYASENIYIDGEFELSGPDNGRVTLETSGGISDSQHISFIPYVSADTGSEARYLYLDGFQIPDQPNYYTINAQVKCEGAGGKVGAGFAWNNGWMMYRGTWVSIQDWDTISFSTVLSPYENSANTGMNNIYLPIVYANTDCAVLHVDNVSILRENPDPITNFSDIAVGAWVENNQFNVVFDNEVPGIIVTVRNNTTEAKIVDLRLRVIDYQGASVFKTSWIEEVQGGMITRKPSVLLDNLKYGSFRVHVRAFINGVEVAHSETDFAKIRDISALSQDSLFGFHYPWSFVSDTEMDQRFSVIGKTYPKQAKGFINRNIVEKIPGVYDWESTTDRLQEYMTTNDVKVLGSISSKVPDWYLSDEGLTDLERRAYQLVDPGFLELIKAAVDRYENIDVWESLNEPYLYYPTNANLPTPEQTMFADNMATYQKSLFQWFNKKYPKKILILNASAIRFKNAENQQFLRTMAQNGVLDYIDALSYHGYTEANPGTEIIDHISWRQQIESELAPYGKEGLTWYMTEAGFQSNDRYDPYSGLYNDYHKIEHRHYSFAPEVTNAGSAIKHGIAHHSHGGKIVTPYYNFMTGISSPSYDLLSNFKFRFKEPTILIPVMNAVTWLYEGFSFHEEIGGDNAIVKAFQFKGPGGGYMTSYWSEEQGMVEIPVCSKSTIYDFMGNEISPEQGGNGRIVPVGRMPRHISSRPNCKLTFIYHQRDDAVRLISDTQARFDLEDGSAKIASQQVNLAEQYDGVGMRVRVYDESEEEYLEGYMWNQDSEEFFGDELVINGDAETQITGWNSLNGAVINQVPSDYIGSNNGSYSLEVVRGLNDVAAYQDLSTIEGKLYRLSVWMKAGSGVARSRIWDWDTFQSIENTVFYNGTTWKHFTGYFVALSDISRIILYVNGDIGDNAYFDDISVSSVKNIGPNALEINNNPYGTGVQSWSIRTPEFDVNSNNYQINIYPVH
ncbi:MAG: carbohydrate binding domain-containing protein [Gammaproteobacteria bacterium]|nr:carbohydrate binding domain-containing protein [Gammaproteobacteria bacterium]